MKHELNIPVISANPIMSFWKKFWKRRTNKQKRGFRAMHNQRVGAGLRQGQSP